MSGLVWLGQIRLNFCAVRFELTCRPGDIHSWVVPSQRRSRTSFHIPRYLYGQNHVGTCCWRINLTTLHSQKWLHVRAYNTRTTRYTTTRHDAMCHNYTLRNYMLHNNMRYFYLATSQQLHATQRHATQHDTRLYHRCSYVLVCGCTLHNITIHNYVHATTVHKYSYIRAYTARHPYMRYNQWSYRCTYIQPSLVQLLTVKEHESEPDLPVALIHGGRELKSSSLYLWNMYWR